MALLPGTALWGRPLTTEEAREVTNMASRIAAIVLMELLLNTNYQAVKNSYCPILNM